MSKKITEYKPKHIIICPVCWRRIYMEGLSRHPSCGSQEILEGFAVVGGKSPLEVLEMRVKFIKNREESLKGIPNNSQCPGCGNIAVLDRDHLLCKWCINMIEENSDPNVGATANIFNGRIVRLKVDLSEKLLHYHQVLTQLQEKVNDKEFPGYYTHEPLTIPPPATEPTAFTLAKHMDIIQDPQGRSISVDIEILNNSRGTALMQALKLRGKEKPYLNVLIDVSTEPVNLMYFFIHDLIPIKCSSKEIQ